MCSFVCLLVVNYSTYADNTTYASQVFEPVQANSISAFLPAGTAAVPTIVIPVAPAVIVTVWSPVFAYITRKLLPVATPGMPADIAVPVGVVNVPAPVVEAWLIIPPNN
jgi:hypothetical protein